MKSEKGPACANELGERSELDSSSSSGKYVSTMTSTAHSPNPTRLSFSLRALACPVFGGYCQPPAAEAGAEMSGDKAPVLTEILPYRLVLPSRPVRPLSSLQS